MIRTIVLGLLGLALAVAVGVGVHLVTRDTISLPVVRLQPAPSLAPPAATTTARRPSTATVGTTTNRVERASGTEPERSETEPGVTDDGSGRGRGRGRGRGGNSGEGGGDD